MNVQKAESALAALEKKKADIVAKLERADADATAAGAERDELNRLETLVVLGEASEKDVARRRDAFAKNSDAAVRRQYVLRAALAEIESRIADATGALLRARRDAAEQAYRTALRERNKGASAVGEGISVDLKRIDALERLRAQADEARRAFVELLDELGEDKPEFPEMDEPDFRPAGWERLAKLLEEGPLQPLARAAAALRQARAEMRRSDELLIRQAAASGRFPVGFPERLRAEAEQLMAAEEERRRAEAARS